VGGKDSTAAAFLLRPHWDRIRFYHWDTGDLLPEVRSVVGELAKILPNLTTLHGDVGRWIAATGCRPTWCRTRRMHVGSHGGEGRASSAVTIAAGPTPWPDLPAHPPDGHTLLIRGTKHADMPRLPMRSGQVLDGIELLLPIADWSDADVMAYLREVGAR
jgi:3'-phosphoadenosine 5'-phosphosulfate sulfotransferase (PAPS reductase)/FAD synthetase